MDMLIIKTAAGKFITHVKSDNDYPNPLEPYAMQVCAAQEPTESYSDAGLIDQDLVPTDSVEFLAKVDVVNHQVVVQP